MQNRDRAVKRIEHLEELLDIEYEKLQDFERESALLGPGPEKTALKLRMQRDTWPTIRKHETEIAGLLAEVSQSESLPDSEVESIFAEVVNEVSSLQSSRQSDWPKEVLDKLDEIQQKLDEPGKAATAKLRASLPIIPFLMSYNLDLDTESTLVQTWRKVKGLFRRASPRPPR
jgi:hypothetical protein